MTKIELRKAKKAQRNLLNKAEVLSKSKLICDRLVSLDEYKNSDSLFLYSSVNNEVSTVCIFEEAITDNKSILMPRVYDKYMEFFRVDSLQDMAKGYMGIPEPTGNVRCFGKNNLLILPGLAFDKNFNRLGYGGGYYDRYLAAHEGQNFVKVGICYDFQLVEAIETDLYDRKVDIIVTESRILKSNEY